MFTFVENKALIERMNSDKLIEWILKFQKYFLSTKKFSIIEGFRGVAHGMPQLLLNTQDDLPFVIRGRSTGTIPFCKNRRVSTLSNSLPQLFLFQLKKYYNMRGCFVLITIIATLTIGLYTFVSFFSFTHLEHEKAETQRQKNVFGVG